LLGGSSGELGVPAAMLPDFGIFASLGDVPVFDFGGDAGGKVAGVEDGGVADAGAALLHLAPHRLDVVPHGVDHADAGHHHPSSHHCPVSC
jgi:hypothetical protein